MRFLFTAFFSANLLVLIAKSSSVINGNRTPSTTSKIYTDNLMVCNLIKDSHVNEAIKTLETKLDNLIALVNKTLPPQPPGKLR